MCGGPEVPPTCVRLERVCVCVCKVTLIVVCQPWVLPLPPSALCEQWGKTPRGLKYEKVLKRGKYLSAGPLCLTAPALLFFYSPWSVIEERQEEFSYSSAVFEHHCYQGGIVAMGAETSDWWKLVERKQQVLLHNCVNGGALLGAVCVIRLAKVR